MAAAPLLSFAMRLVMVLPNNQENIVAATVTRATTPNIAQLAHLIAEDSCPSAASRRLRAFNT